MLMKSGLNLKIKGGSFYTLFGDNLGVALDIYRITLTLVFVERRIQTNFIKYFLIEMFETERKENICQKILFWDCFEKR